MFDWLKGFESVSSSSQANEVKELRRDSVRTSSKGLRDEGVKGLRKKGRICGMDGGRGQAKGGRFFMKGGGSRPGV